MQLLRRKRHSSRRAQLEEVWRRYKRNRPAVIGLGLTGFLSFLAVFAPFIAPYDFFTINSLERFQPPSRTHLMGTDHIGRDILSGVVNGARVSLSIGAVSALISMIVGILIGATAGYSGGIIDDTLMRFTEMFLVIPPFFLVLIVAAIFGGNILNVMLIVGLTAWPGTARLVRAQFMSLKEQEFVLAARAGGVGDFRIVFRHILPNALYPVIINTSLQIPRAILLEAGLSFLGLGDPNLISWGQLLNMAQTYMRIAWWMSVFPGLMIFVTVISLNQVGDGLNDALNPRLREG
jgi:peptide/nickel transport system permease protein